jgi:MFS transporter, ACS family, solute carrier family 17 (sodium-dependent inorganic phosphate cotransporter), other
VRTDDSMFVTRVLGAPTVRMTLMLSLALAWVLSYCDRVNLSVAVIPMQAALGWPEATKGILLAAVFVGYISSQLLGGWLTLRYGAVRLMAVAIVGFSTMTLVTPWVAQSSLAALLLVRVLLGVFEGLAIPASYTLIGRWSRTTERARMLAIVLSGATLGAPIGLMASGVMVQTVGWESMFYVFATLGFVWAVFWVRVAHDDPDEHPRISAAERELLAESRVPPARAEAVPFRRILTHRSVWAAAVAKFSMGWTIYVLLAWLPSYFVATHGISVAGSGFLAALPWITLTALLHVAGSLADRMLRGGYDVTFVRKLMQSIGIGGSLTCLMLTATADSLIEAVLFTCAATGSLAFCYSGVEAAMVDMAPRYRGFVTGLASTAGNIPGVIAIPIIGWMVDRSGSYAGGFVSAAVVGAVGLVAWLLFGTGKKVID